MTVSPTATWWAFSSASILPPDRLISQPSMERRPGAQAERGRPSAVAAPGFQPSRRSGGLIGIMMCPMGEMGSCRVGQWAIANDLYQSPGRSHAYSLTRQPRTGALGSGKKLLGSVQSPLQSRCREAPPPPPPPLSRTTITSAVWPVPAVGHADDAV